MSDLTRTPSDNRNEWSQTADEYRDSAVTSGGLADWPGSGFHENPDTLDANVSVMERAPRVVVRSVNDVDDNPEGVAVNGMAENVAHLIRQNCVPAVDIGIGLSWFAPRKSPK